MNYLSFILMSFTVVVINVGLILLAYKLIIKIIREWKKRN